MRASVSVLDVRTGRVIGEFERRDTPSRIDRLADSITFSLVRELSHTPQIGSVRLSALGTNSLGALKAFLQGEQYFRRSAWDSAEFWYEKALAIDSEFALANASMGEAYGWSHTNGDSLSVLYSLRAAQHNRGLAPRDSLLIVAESLAVALDQPGGDPHDLQHRRRMMAAAELAAQRYPDDPYVLYRLGDLRYHYAYGKELGLSIEKLIEAFDRAIAADSTFTPSYIHAIQLAYRLGGTEGGRRYLHRYIAQNPRDLDAEVARLVDRLTDPKQAGSGETAKRLAGASNDLLDRAAIALIVWPDSGQTAVRLDQMLSPSRRSEYARDADTTFQQFRVSRGLLFRGRAREAFAKTNAMSWQQGAIAYLGGYSPTEARQLFQAQVREKRGCPLCFYDYWASRSDVASLEWAQRMLDSAFRIRPDTIANMRRVFAAAYGQAYLALARHDSAAALRTLQALPDSLCATCYSYALTQAQLLEAQHRDREALEILSRPGLGASVYQTAMLLERARVAERLGERAIAVDGYLYVANAWAPGDPIFQPYVKEARAALKRLGGEGAPGLLANNPSGSR